MCDLFLNVCVIAQDDRALVSLHLMATSAFLLTTFLVMVCFAAVGGGHRTKNVKAGTPSSGRDNAQAVGDDKEPLNP